MDTTPTRNGASVTNGPYIGEYPGVCGGYPVIERMRFPVRIVINAYRTLGDIDTIVEAYPQLTKAQVRCALDYYAEYPARVDEDIARHERAYAEAHGLPWPA